MDKGKRSLQTNAKLLAKSIYKGANNQLDNRVMGSMTRLRLVKLNPITFFHTEQVMDLQGDFLVLPKHKVFTIDDLNKNFVFFRNTGGQEFYYMYEPSSPNGSNGTPTTDGRRGVI